MSVKPNSVVKNTPLLILGVHLSSEGYPNVKYRVEKLLNSPELRVEQINKPVFSEKALGQKSLFLRHLSTILRFFYSHFYVFVHYLTAKNKAVVYIPYPAIFIVWMISLLPKRFLPKILIIDAFISIYDTVVNDRKLVSKQGWLAKLLNAVERRAFSTASTVITDTDENSAYYSEMFRLPLGKFLSVPLATNEREFTETRYMPKEGRVKVLFFGTFVPLHGVGTILAAIKRLIGEDIEFTLIGNGQDGPLVEQFIVQYPGRINWIHKWQSAEALAEQIDSADICLGIFGRGAKTQRVCPYKIYAYAAMGRAVITADTLWTRRTCAELQYQPFETVAVGDVEALSNAILNLAKSAESRKALASRSARYYHSCLSNEVGHQVILMLIQSSRPP